MLKKMFIIAMASVALTVAITEQSTRLANTQQSLQESLEAQRRLEDELSVTQADLQEAIVHVEDAQAELVKYVEPLQYNSADAPTYSSLPITDELQQYTYNTCVVYGIEEYYTVVLAIMWRESHFDPSKISTTNDYGIMQINACNHAYLMRNLGLVDMLDPYDNIEGGVYLLSTLFDQYDDVHKVLMAYNMGPGNASAQWSRGNYTSAYSNDILAKAELIESNNYSE